MSDSEDDTLQFHPRNPLVQRDGRDLSLYHPTTGINLPLPTVVAGMVRAQYYEENITQANQDVLPSQVLSIAIRGPWLSHQSEVHTPPPADAIPQAVENSRAFHYRKLQLSLGQAGTGGSWSRSEASGNSTVKSTNHGQQLADQLHPYREPIEENQSQKSQKLRQRHKPQSWWQLKDTTRWLIDPVDHRQVSEVPELLKFETRAHVSLHNLTNTAEPGMIFATGGPRFADDVSLNFQLISNDENSKRLTEPKRQRICTLGGEGRTGILQPANHHFPRLTESLFRGDKKAPSLAHWITQQKQKYRLLGVRLYLLTPAQCYPFPLPADDSTSAGADEQTSAQHSESAPAWACPWMYQHLDNDGRYFGQHPANRTLALRLTGLCMPAGGYDYSGWNLNKGGPRAVRRLVPAGSIYDFAFHHEAPDDKTLADWLQSLWGGSLDGNELPAQHDELLAAPADDGLGMVLPGLRWANR